VPSRRRRGWAASRAAEELDTSAASVSYHVRRQAQTGTCLFLRHAQHVELTVAGASVAVEATRAFDALRASFMRAADMDASRLRLSVLPALGTSWLTPRLGSFRARQRSCWSWICQHSRRIWPPVTSMPPSATARANGRVFRQLPCFQHVHTVVCASAAAQGAWAGQQRA
jgi:DNA-binding transcriptional LysR family regulator